MLTKQKISYPYIQYKMDITHVTSRRFTAVEWLILISAMQITKRELMYFRSFSIENFFSGLFGLADANALIKPLLLEMQNLQLLVLNHIDDNSDMKETTMDQIHLAPLGVQCLQTEKLPGKPSHDFISVLYHISSNQIEFHQKFTNKKEGIPIVHIENQDEVLCPLNLIQEKIIQIGAEKKLSWYQEGTSIVKIIPQESVLLWKTTEHQVSISEQFEVSVEGIDDVNIHEMVLQQYQTENKAQDIPEVSFVSLSEISRIGQSNDIQQWISADAEKSRIYLINAVNDLPEQRGPYVGQKKGVYNVRIVCKSLVSYENTSVAKPGELILKIPGEIFPNEIKYMSESSYIGIGKFPLHAGNVSVHTPLAYSVVQQHPQFKKFIINIIERYYLKDPACIFLYHALGMIDEFKDYLTRYVRSTEDITTQIARIDALNDTARQLYKGSCISPEERKQILINPSEIKKNVSDFSSAKKYLQHFIFSKNFNRHHDLVECLISNVFDCIDETVSLKKLHHMWRFMTSKSGDNLRYINIVNSRNLYQRFYTSDIIIQLGDYYRQFDYYPDFFEKCQEYTPYEIVLRDIKLLEKKIGEWIPSLHRNDDIETILEGMSYFNKNPADVDGFLNDWDNLKQLYPDIIDAYLNRKRSGITELADFLENKLPMASFLYRIQKLQESCHQFLPELSFSDIPDKNKMRQQILDTANQDQAQILFALMQEWEKVSENVLFSSYPHKEILTEIFENLSEILHQFYYDVEKFDQLYVLDTNVLLHQENILNFFNELNIMVIIPTIVLAELDGLKNDADPDLAANARRAINHIDMFKKKLWINLKEESIPELLSKDLDPHKPDSKILSVALKFKSKMPYLVTNDTELRNIAFSQNIQTISSTDCVKQLKKEKKKNKIKK